MDGYPIKKNKVWRGQTYSETRYYVCTWLEKELPLVVGNVLNVASGGWPVPYQLLDKTKVTKYTTFDQKVYGDSKNTASVYGDVHAMPFKDEEFDVLICNQAAECFANIFVAMDEMFRVLKRGGTLYIDSPFNYVWFGRGSNPESLKKKNPVKDYWRISKDGWELLAKKFSKVDIQGFGGTENSRFVYCVKAVK